MVLFNFFLFSAIIRTTKDFKSCIHTKQNVQSDGGSYRQMKNLFFQDNKKEKRYPIYLI